MSNWEVSARGEVTVFQSNDQVVLVIEAGSALNATRGLGGGYLVLYANPHPRPSFMIEGIAAGILYRALIDRLGLTSSDASNLAEAIANHFRSQGRTVHPDAK